jgi:hypothetical protein
MLTTKPLDTASIVDILADFDYLTNSDTDTG